jgi:hypothetical protein
MVTEVMKKNLIFILVFGIILLNSLTFIQGANILAPPKVSGEPTGEQTLNTNTYYINYKVGGCLFDKKLYPYGYIKDGKYCAEEYNVKFPNGQHRYTKTDVFVEQKNISEECINNFECKTNYCSEGICKNQIEEINNKITGEISVSVNKEIDERKDEALDKIEAQLENLDENKTYSVKVENVKIPVNKTIMKQFLNWFKEILN